MRKNLSSPIQISIRGFWFIQTQLICRVGVFSIRCYPCIWSEPVHAHGEFRYSDQWNFKTGLHQLQIERIRICFERLFKKRPQRVDLVNVHVVWEEANILIVDIRNPSKVIRNFGTQLEFFFCKGSVGTNELRKQFIM